MGMPAILFLLWEIIRRGSSLKMELEDLMDFNNCFSAPSSNSNNSAYAEPPNNYVSSLLQFGIY